MEKVKRATHQLDATGQSLGRLATQVALLLRGKNKPTFAPHKDEGDYVEVINCDKMRITGKKLEQKEYKWHTMHPGGLKSKKMKEIFVARPGEVLARAVYGMLPDNRLKDEMFKRLKTK